MRCDISVVNNTHQ